MPSTDRTTYLKDHVVSKACHGGDYLPEVKPDLERALLYTESFKATEGQPMIIRRAKILEHLLDNMTLYIQPKELIIGNYTPAVHKLYLSPEINVETIREVIEDGYFNEEDNKKAQELVDFWEDKCMKNWVEDHMTEHEKEVIAHGSPVLSVTHRDGGMHCVPNWEYVYAEGFDKIIERINAFLTIEKNKIKPEQKKIDLYESMLITCHAFLRWTARYATLARDMAAKEEDAQQKKEFLEIATILDRLLKAPPVTLQEAIQGFFLIHLVLSYIDRAGFGCLARVDQMWIEPFLKDKSAGRLDDDQALELLECLWIKMIDCGYWFPRKRRSHFDGNSLLQTLTVAGVKKDGTDACNELTPIVMRSVKSTRNNQPTFNFRYHPGVDDAALESAIEVTKTGMGMPAFLNDNLMIQSLTGQGIPLHEARDWAVVACVSAAPCNMQVTTTRLAQTSITAKEFELMLYNGKCPCCNKQLGPETGDVTKMTWEELLEAFRLQVKHAYELGVHVRNISHEWEHEYLFRPFASALHRSPVFVGKDVCEYEDCANNWMNCVGVVDTIDSFAVIKKMIYDEKKYTWDEMMEILKSDFKGKEIERQKFINKVPKFGNDDEYVDGLGKEIFHIIATEAYKVKDSNNGGGFRILPQSVAWYVWIGKHVSALPSGRKSGVFLADGGASPYHGMDRNGPTAVLKSVGKLEHNLTKGVLLNQRFMPEALEGKEGMDRFKAYLKSWYELGCSQIQFNCVSNETLLDAMKHPENHRDLIVRVAGYSAYFTQLSKDVQNAIVNRHAQTF